LSLPALSSVKVPDGNLNIAQLNVRGINDVTKFLELKSTLMNLATIPDVIVLSETKLKPSFPVKIYSIGGFNLFSCSRTDGAGGGVLVYVRSAIPVDRIDLSPVSFERVQLSLHLGFSRFAILATYRAPNRLNFDDFISELEVFLSSSNGKALVIGDVNIGFPKCSDDPVDAPTRKYLDLIESFDFKVSNNQHQTRPASGRIIDHLVTNFHSEHDISNFTCEIDSDSYDHNLVFSTISCNKQRRDVGCVTRRKLDYTSLLANFSLSLSNFASINDSNLIAECLTRDLQLATTRSTKTTNFSVKHAERIRDWNSATTLELMTEKNKLLKKRRKKPTNNKVKLRLHTVSVKLKNSLKSDFSRDIHNKLSTKDPKKLWMGINEVIGRSKSDRTTLIEDPSSGTQVTDPAEMATIFNNFFASCGPHPRSKNIANQFTERTPRESMVLFPPTESEVSNQISRLRNNCAPGFDGINSRTLKALSSAITPIMTRLITVIFETGIFPSCLKTAVTIPIFKSGVATKVENYRPVSILSSISKIIEGILFQRLNDYFTKHTKLLFSRQFGFREGSSTETATVELSGMIQDAIDKKKCATGVFMDLKKAFDLVDHEALLNVLENYGVRGEALKPFASYLQDRRQVVRIDKEISTEVKIHRGVVQGSKLGPLLFLIFINAIGFLKISGRIFLFADDAVLVNTHEATADNEGIQARIASDMWQILEFFQHRQLILNASKTNFMLFKSARRTIEMDESIDINPDVSISRVRSMKYLGLVVNESFTWTDHIQALRKKLAPAAGILWKLRDFLPLHARKLIFNSLFLSHVNYLIPVWGFAPSCQMNELQVLHNRSLRNVFDIPTRTSRVEMFLRRVGNHLPIRGIFVVRTASAMFKTITNSIHTNVTFTRAGENHERRLRNHNQLRPSSSSSRHGDQSFTSIGPKIFNRIPESIRASKSPSSFTWSVKRLLATETFIESCFNNSFFELKF
jgi:hypothetical protein